MNVMTPRHNWQPIVLEEAGCKITVKTTVDTYGNVKWYIEFPLEAKIFKGGRHLKNNGQPLTIHTRAPLPERYFLIVKDSLIIGSCLESGIEDVLDEEPGATLLETTREVFQREDL